MYITMDEPTNLCLRLSMILLTYIIIIQSYLLPKYMQYMYMYTMLDIFLSLSLVLSTETTTMATSKSIHFFITKTNFT